MINNTNRYNSILKNTTIINIATVEWLVWQCKSELPRTRKINMQVNKCIPFRLFVRYKLTWLLCLLKLCVFCFKIETACGQRSRLIHALIDIILLLVQRLGSSGTWFFKLMAILFCVLQLVVETLGITSDRYRQKCNKQYYIRNCSLDSLL